MPYKSDAQRRYMHAKHPKIAAKWDAEEAAVKKAFENHPKVRMQAFSVTNTDAQGRRTEYMPSHATTHARGKSLILRRPKYQVVGAPGKAAEKAKGKKALGRMTPNARLKGEDARTFQNAYKTKAKKVKTSTGYEFTHEVGKRMDRDKRLAAQKKVSAGTSVVGGTLGLGGLAALAFKKEKLATRLSIGAGGLGGVGAYNYASIQNQEAKKRPPKQNIFVVRNKKQIRNIKSGLEPVKKDSGGLMDFGLSSVHQGEDVDIISKRQKPLENKRDKQANAAAVAGGAGVLGMYGAETHSAVRHVQTGGAVPPRSYQGTLLKERIKEGYAGYKKATKEGYTNRRTGTKHGPIPRRKMVKPLAKFGAQSLKANPHAAVFAGGAALATGGYGSAIALKRSADKQRAGQKRIKKNDDLVFKAYNPEAKRQRRLDHTSTALAAGAGGTGLAAFVTGRKALGVSEQRSQKWSTKTVKVKSAESPSGQKAYKVSEQGRPRVTRKATGLRSADIHEFRGGLKNAGKAGALGVTAVGLAVGADRVKQYGRGRGGSYRPLLRSS